MSPTFLRQIYAAVLGLAVMLVITYIPQRFIQSSTYFIYAISILALIIVLIIGKTTAGTKGWINLGSITFQPAELAKFAVVLILAKNLSGKGSDINTFRGLGTSIIYVLIPVALIMLQPDVGSALVLFVILIGMMLWTGFSLFLLYFIVCLPIIIIAGFLGQIPMIVLLILISITTFFFKQKLIYSILVLLIFIIAGVFSPYIFNNLMPHQKARIESFINPNADPQGKGYNVLQSKLAVGSGGFAGKGFLKGTQTQLRYIPKQWTDFIFSVPTEEFGFIGGAIVILLLMSIILRSLRIATEADNTFSSIAAIGITSVFTYHTVINIGMAIGLMPVMGIPLPFLSAGGTALVVNMAMVGILLNIFRSKRVKRKIS